MQTEVMVNEEYYILLIEDDKVDQLFFSKAIEGFLGNVTCHMVSSLNEAKRLIEDGFYNIIVADMSLPDSNGLEVIKSILKYNHNIPVVVLSDNDDDAIAHEAVRLGAQDYLPKSYLSNKAFVKRCIRHSIERHSLMRDLEITLAHERRQAQYDLVTALPNRAVFLDRLKQAICQARRHDRQFTVCLMNLNFFKEVNERLGHNAGDEVLRATGARMKNLLRESDTVARFDGDEFVFILHEVSDSEHLEILSEKIINSVSERISYGRHTCTVGASIGFASYPKDGLSPETLLKHASVAMDDDKKLKPHNSHELVISENLLQ